MIHAPTKPLRRLDRETPYRRDRERSEERAMARGIMPKTLDGLIAWLMECESSEVPSELHKHEVWRDYGQHAEGGSHLGSPAYADGFRRILEDSPSTIDADGYYLKPLRAALSRLRRRRAVWANHIDTLIRLEGAWRVWADKEHMHPEVAEGYLGTSLRELWREHEHRVERMA